MASVLYQGPPVNWWARRCGPLPYSGLYIPCAVAVDSLRSCISQRYDRFQSGYGASESRRRLLEQESFLLLLSRKGIDRLPHQCFPKRKLEGWMRVASYRNG
jgi:hypothetical protein